MRRQLYTAFLAAALFLGVAACGGTSEADAHADPTAGPMTGPTTDLVVADAWVRATIGTEDPSMTGAFMTIDNDGELDLRLTGASSPAARMVELHEMVLRDGKPVMQRVDGGLEISAGKGKVLMPGGNHLMLMGLADELAPGDEVELILEFSDGSTRELTVPVKAFTEEEPHYHSSQDADPSMSPAGAAQ